MIAKFAAVSSFASTPAPINKMATSLSGSHTV